MSTQDLPARIALLQVRSAFGGGRSTAPSTFRIQSGGPLLEYSAAVNALAQLPKPVGCAPHLGDGFIDLGARLLNAEERKAREQFVEYWRKRGGFLAEPHDPSSGDPGALVFCVGDDETLLCRVVDYNEFQESYDVAAGGLVGGPPGWFLNLDPAAAREAHRLGARHLLRFVEREDDRTSQSEGWTIAVRQGGWGNAQEVLEHAPGSGEVCRRCGKEPVKWRLTDTGPPDWPEVQLCGGCAADWLLEMERRMVARYRDSFAKHPPDYRGMAADLYQAIIERWKRLPVRDEVQAILEWFRKVANTGDAE